MKLLQFTVMAAVAALTAALGSGCSEDEGIDNRERDYGYVQFKIYKEASYRPAPASRAIQDELEYLAQATKVKVTLQYGEMTLAQTLTLTAADKESAEEGLRSEKLKLLTGDYRIVTFSLFDANDQELYIGDPNAAPTFAVHTGGLTVHDLTAKVTPRGGVRFTLVKDKNDFPNKPTRAVERQYTFDEIAYADITVQHKATSRQTTFENLKMTFSIHFDDEEDTSEEEGYRTSSSTCDSLLSLEGGEYRILSYVTKDKSKNTLEVNARPKQMTFTVDDNRVERVDLTVTLYESDAYIQDYYALYRIWQSLDGENWYYKGESWPVGINWDFNKDVDLWGDQPGVQLHSNGRVAILDVSGFGARGALSSEVGKLTELVQLLLGTHNDFNALDGDPTVPTSLEGLTEWSRNRHKYNSAFLEMVHPATQLSEAVAFGLRQNGIVIPATALYEKYSEAEIIDRATGRQKQLRPTPYDMVPGKLSNGITSIPREIGNLRKLENIFIANGAIEELPDEFAQLESLTDLELYNCPKMTSFPTVITRLPKLIQINISNNPQWSAADIEQGFKDFANGPSAEELQVIFSVNNSMEELPAEVSKMIKLSKLDLAYNKIHTLNPLGRDVQLVQLNLDHNLIESIPRDAEGYFCGYNDMETFSVTYNKLRKVPDIFNAKSKYVMKTVDFSGNLIDGFENEGAGYRGLNAETLTLTNNPGITKFPKELFDAGSQITQLNLRGCSIDEIPEGSLRGKYVYYLGGIDLSYNKLKKLPDEFAGETLPYLQALDLSFNAFTAFPFGPLSISNLTAYSIRAQRDERGNRTLREWPQGVYQHKGLRALYLGSNDLRKIDDTISYLIFNLDISDNPNITFDASDICYYIQQGVFTLIYDKTQNITHCDILFN